ncbi:MAG: DUF1698 domain-containing protein [Candidatus Hodarchaeota archaeon]
MIIKKYQKYKRKLKTLRLRIFDPKRINELKGERVVFTHLKKCGFLDNFENKRILEIGPKHGKDSFLLATLKPKELILIDLPSKRSKVDEWFPQLNSILNSKYIEGNILYLNQNQYEQLEKFDLIWCLGVIYHNIEQVRLLRRLFDLCNFGGSIVLESSTTRNKKLRNLNVVEIHWPKPFENIPTVTHHPSRLALKSWLEMVGFSNVMFREIYSKVMRRRRVVLTGSKTIDSKPYVYYDVNDLNPNYSVGDAT